MRSPSTGGAVVPAKGPVSAPSTPTTILVCATAGRAKAASASTPIQPYFTAFHFFMIFLPFALFVRIRPSGAQCSLGRGRDEPFLAIVVHRLDQMFEPVIHLRAFDLACRRNRFAFFLWIQRLRKNPERFDLLDARSWAFAFSTSPRISASISS